MAPKTVPGTLGLRRGSAIDSGTLVRTPTAPPGVTVPLDLPGLEEISRSTVITRAMAYADDVDGKEVGWVYFVVNDDKVRQSDQIQMMSLVKSLQDRIKDGFIIGLMCEGSADYRAPDRYNYNLGKRRAESVAQFLMASAPGVVALTKSIGESAALRPKGGKRPPRSKIKKDRRVTITIAADGLLPPVRLAVESTGKWKDWNALERREVKNGGKVVSPEGYAGDDAARRAIEYMRSGRTKEKPGPYDPFRVVAIIKCQYSEKPTSGGIESEMKCEVVHKRTGKVLFSGSDKGHKTAPGRIPGLEANVYDKLRGKYKNITERVKAVLGRK